MSLEQKNSTDEIDLLDLLLQLWNGKKTIITTVCIAIVLLRAEGDKLHSRKLRTFNEPPFR
ncbi:hypothetical protein ACBQ19_11580 [Hafnia alvei]